MKSKSNLTAYIERKSGNRLFTSVIVTWAQHVNWSSVKRNSSNKKEMCRIRALSTNILSIVLKYLVCLPGGWEASLSLDKPVSHQRTLKNQNVFWNFEGSWDTVIVLSAFEVRSSQAAKSKRSSSPRKIPSGESWPICQVLVASKFGKRELVLDL